MFHNFKQTDYVLGARTVKTDDSLRPQACSKIHGLLMD